MSRSPHGIEPDLEDGSKPPEPRPKARLADSRRAGWLGELPRARNDLVSIVSASKSKKRRK
jgi:hypothetical protein